MEALQNEARIGVRLPVELATKVDRLARQTHRTKSEVVRLLIASALVCDVRDIYLETKAN